jgi:type VI protein secretion system component Hcp
LRTEPAGRNSPAGRYGFFLLGTFTNYRKNAMLSDNFMWIPEKGGTQIIGETSDVYFSTKNAFEVSKFAFKVTGAEAAEGQSGSKGKAKFGSFSIDKVVDTASVPLYKACTQATIFPSICLAVRKSGGSFLIYMEYIFRYNQIIGIDWDGGSGSERPKETITFSFKAMGLQYIPQLPDGREGRPQQWSWNVSDQGSATLTIAGIDPPPDFIAGSASSQMSKKS